MNTYLYSAVHNNVVYDVLLNDLGERFYIDSDGVRYTEMP